MDLPEVGSMSSTNSANPIACSAGLAVLEEIQNKKLTDKARVNGQLMHNELLRIKKKHPNLFNVYGKGLIAAIVFNKSQKNINTKLKILVEKCIKDGLLLVYTGRESVKIGPPLTITKDAINGYEYNNLELIESRDDAIKTGLKKLNNHNVLAILGKGHETFIEIAGKKILFNDRDCVLRNARV